MLSAVAARKAKLEARQLSQQPSTSTTTEENAAKNEKPLSKRKLSQRTSKKPESKKRKVTRKEEKGRYFVQDETNSQHEVILVDDELSDSSEGEAHLDENEPKTFARRWSPSAPLHSSDDEEAVGLEEEAPAFGLAPTVGITNPQSPPLLSTWRPIKNQTIFTLESKDVQALRLVDTANARLCTLRKGDRLTLVGVYSLTVVHGAVILAGTKLLPQTGTHKVFAPWSSPLPAIECAAARSSSGDVSTALSPRLQQVVSGADAAIIVQELSTGIEGLGRICRTFENVFTLPGARPVDDMEMNGIHYVEIGTRTLCPFIVPHTWDRACRSVLEESDQELSRPIYVVQGAKKTGKSSFARMLSNALSTKYKKVAFLECDIGQSEFTPGGMVALNIIDAPFFGPPFSHPSVPYQAHYIGSTSPRECPHAYIEAISTLLHSYEVDVQFGEDDSLSSGARDTRIADGIPLVINTMGWAKGLGADLLLKILDIAQPTQVFNIDAAPAEDDWSPYQKDASTQVLSQDTMAGFKTDILQSPVSTGNTVRFTPADYRNISLLSYLHAVFAPDISSDGALRSTYATSWKTSLPLCAQIPYEINVQDAVDAIILVGAGAEDVVPSELSRVLNGALVGLVSHDSTLEEATRDPITGLPYTQGSLPPLPSTSRCHGLALVRSSLGNLSGSPKFQLLTPIPLSILSRASPRVLVKGSMELPVWGWLDFRDAKTVAGVETPYVPYLRWGKGEGAGADKRRARRNLPRYGLY